MAQSIQQFFSNLASGKGSWGNFRRPKPAPKKKTHSIAMWGDKVMTTPSKSGGHRIGLRSSPSVDRDMDISNKQELQYTKPKDKPLIKSSSSAKVSSDSEIKKKYRLNDAGRLASTSPKPRRFKKRPTSTISLPAKRPALFQTVTRGENVSLPVSRPLRTSTISLPVSRPSGLTEKIKPLTKVNTNTNTGNKMVRTSEQIMSQQDGWWSKLISGKNKKANAGEVVQEGTQVVNPEKTDEIKSIGLVPRFLKVPKKFALWWVKEGEKNKNFGFK